MSKEDLEIYREIARRYGVDPNDEDALIRFFREELARQGDNVRDRVFLEILAATTGLEHLQGESSGLIKDPVSRELDRVASGLVSLDRFDGDILRYCKEVIWPTLPEIERLEAHLHRSIETAFAQIDPAKDVGDVSRALVLASWVAHYQSIGVVRAFARFLRSAGSAHAGMDNVHEEALVLLGAVALRNAHYLDDVIRESATPGASAEDEAAYVEYLSSLHALSRHARHQAEVALEIVVTERDPPRKAMAFAGYAMSGATAADLQRVLGRLGAEVVCNLARDTIVDTLAARMTSPADLTAMAAIGRLLIDMTEVMSYERKRIRSGAPVTTRLEVLWTRLEEARQTPAMLEELVP